MLATTLFARDGYVSTSVSTGNEAVSGVEDYVEWLVDDPDTHVIAMYVESLRRPQAFLAAARRAREAGKPIVMLHPGKSNKAQESAATHTGAMAGDYALMKAKVAREGVIFAETLEELGDIATMAVTCKALPGANMAVLGESGALRGLAFDIAEDIGLDLVDLNDAQQPGDARDPARLRAGVEPDRHHRARPVGAGDLHQGPDRAARGRAGRLGGRLDHPVGPDHLRRSSSRTIIKVLEDGTFPKPLVFAGVDEGARVPPEYVDGLRKVGIPWFPSTERAYRAIARLADLSKRDLTDRTPAAAAGAGARRRLGRGARIQGQGTAPAARHRLPRERVRAHADEAAAAAERIGYPVVMKAQAAALGHKSDAGGVILNSSPRTTCAKPSTRCTATSPTTSLRSRSTACWSKRWAGWASR